MRRYLRQRSDAIWVIDCSPEGHQPPTNTRVFEDVQQPVCIVLAVRDGSTGDDQPASVRFRELSEGVREAKFQELSALTLDDGGWRACPEEWQAPFAPAAQGRWANFPTLDDLLSWSGSGMMPGRTWVAPGWSRRTPRPCTEGGTSSSAPSRATRLGCAALRAPPGSAS